MVFSSDFRMGQYEDDDHRGDAPHFAFWKSIYYSMQNSDPMTTLDYDTQNQVLHSIMLHSFRRKNFF